MCADNELITNRVFAVERMHEIQAISRTTTQRTCSSNSSSTSVADRMRLVSVDLSRLTATDLAEEAIMISISRKDAPCNAQ